MLFPFECIPNTIRTYLLTQTQIGLSLNPLIITIRIKGPIISNRRLFSGKLTSLAKLQVSPSNAQYKYRKYTYDTHPIRKTVNPIGNLQYLQKMSIGRRKSHRWKEMHGIVTANHKAPYPQKEDQKQMKAYRYLYSLVGKIKKSVSTVSSPCRSSYNSCHVDPMSEIENSSYTNYEFDREMMSIKRVLPLKESNIPAIVLFKCENITNGRRNTVSYSRCDLK